MNRGILMVICMIGLGAPGVVEAAGAESSKSLAERLGFARTDKLLIVNGDDAGMCHAANVATFDAMENGLMTSATVMVPCPWFLEVIAYAREHPQADFGLHLTHTSEWRQYRWGPVAPAHEVPGLIDPAGYLWREEREVYAHATPEQAEKEARAQIVRALQAGLDVTHLDSHMGTLHYDMRYHAVYRKLANEFDLPIRMASPELLAQMGGGHLRAELAADGIVCPDYLIHGDRQPGETVKAYWLRHLRALRPGVTELYIHAAKAGDEISAITASAAQRAQEYELFTRDAEIRQILDDQKVQRIGYRVLRELQRGSRKAR